MSALLVWSGFVMVACAVASSKVSSCELDPTQKTWCVVDEFAPPEKVGEAMDFICSTGVDCKACPDSNDWAFNSYFQLHWKQDGAVSCDFAGAGKLTYPSTSPCRPSTASKMWCLPKEGTSTKALQSSVDFICGQVDCSALKEGSGCVFPGGKELTYMAEWAYNAYYSKDSKVASCDFQGTGELMNSDCTPTEDQKTWCTVAEDASAMKVFPALIYIRQHAKTLLSNYDRCPFNSRKKDSWVYNEMFKLNYKTAGNEACDFSGTGRLSWPVTSPCRPSKFDGQPSGTTQWCLPKPSATVTQLSSGIGFVCQSLGCTLIASGGECVYPKDEDLIDKAQWAFNTYFQKNFRKQGQAACNFGGAAQLVDMNKGLPPAQPVAPPKSDCTLDPKQHTWCVVSLWAASDVVESSLQSICENREVDCSKCPNSADWKYNEYFQQNWEKDGAKACDWKGTGKLLWSPSSPCRPSQDDKQWCLPKTAGWPSKRDDLGDYVDNLCKDMDCSVMNAGTACVFPPGLEIIYKAEWVYNTKYKQTHECPSVNGWEGEFMDPGCKANDDQISQCKVSDNAAATTVFTSVVWLCTSYKVMCDRCQPESHTKDSWIYNEFFKLNYKGASGSACDFKGSGQITWPASSPCRPKSSEKNWCVAKSGVSDEQLGQAIGYVCSDGKVDCSLIGAGGDCVYPEKEAASYKATWAFNTFFQREGKKEACDFGGLATISWPEGSPCRLNKSDGTWCVAKPGLNPQVLVKDISNVCGLIDCSMIAEGGGCMFPTTNEVKYKADWVFNKYYQKYKGEGKSACDFGGHATLVSPSASSSLVHSLKQVIV